MERVIAQSRPFLIILIILIHWQYDAESCYSSIESSGINILEYFQYLLIQIIAVH